MVKTVLVTGGTGLVGSAINSIKNVYPWYHFVFLDSKKCDLLNFDSTISLFREIQPNYVIHLAACVGGLFKNMSQKVKMLEENLLINTNVLKCSNLVGVERLVACLSTCIFPDRTEYPINESMINNGPPHSSNEGYAYSKRILEIQCKTYNEQYSTNYFCVIPTNIYGPSDNFNLEDSHVIPGLIHRCFLASKSNETFVVKGTGSPLRQFIYSGDLAKIIIELLMDHSSTDSVIITPKEEHSIKSIAEMINSHFGCKIEFDPTFSDGQFRKTADNSKLMSIFPELKFTSISTGISETVEWFKKKYPDVRL